MNKYHHYCIEFFCSISENLLQMSHFWKGNRPHQLQYNLVKTLQMSNDLFACPQRDNLCSGIWWIFTAPKPNFTDLAVWVFWSHTIWIPWLQPFCQISADPHIQTFANNRDHPSLRPDQLASLPRTLPRLLRFSPFIPFGPLEFCNSSYIFKPVCLRGGVTPRTDPSNLNLSPDRTLM